MSGSGSRDICNVPGCVGFFHTSAIGLSWSLRFTILGFFRASFCKGATAFWVEARLTPPGRTAIRDKEKIVRGVLHKPIKRMRVDRSERSYHVTERTQSKADWS